MPHGFVLAQLFSRLDDRVTYPDDMPTFPPTQPFLALRVNGRDISQKNDDANYLFVLSPEKPTGPHANRYFSLGPTAEKRRRVLAVEPPWHAEQLGSLFIHISPFIEEAWLCKCRETAEFRLDKTSFRIFCKFAREVMTRHARQKEIDSHAARRSGGDEPVGSDWRTFGSTVHFDSGYPFKYLPFELSSSMIKPPSIFKDLLLYKQFYEDYSWQGVDVALDWSESLRVYTRDHGLRDISQNIELGAPHPVKDLRSLAEKLQSMRIPWDGEPPPQLEDDASSGIYWDPPSPFKVAPIPRPDVIAGNILVFAIDAFETIFDRNTAVKEAISTFDLACVNTSKYTATHLLEVYLECELIRCMDFTDAEYADICRGALEDLVSQVGLSATESELDAALRILSRPPASLDAIAGLKALSDEQHTLLILPSLDSLPLKKLRKFDSLVVDSVKARTYFQSYHPSGRGIDLLMQNPSLFDRLFERARSLHPGIQRDQIVVVTASPHRTLEPARAAGFPVTLLPQTSSSASNVLADLSPPPPRDARPGTRQTDEFYGFRVHDMYQFKTLLGNGLSAEVFGGYDLYTGENVAGKVELLSEDEPDAVPSLPYEALIYRMLQGHCGIPSLRWAGTDHGGHVLVLDRLGANVEQLRRLCRGRLSHKTVLILAMQMLDRIEFAHSRGIVVRDIKPTNFVMGVGARSSVVHLIDFGLAKLFQDPRTGQHIPYREGRVFFGTARFASYNIHFGREQSRRDDLEMLGNTLLHLYHGRMPWQGIYAPNEDAKLLRIGEMKSGKPFRELLERSPEEFTKFFDHCRSLRFEEKPNYRLLMTMFHDALQEHGWDNDGIFDWVDGMSLEQGTLLRDEYKKDVKFVSPDNMKL